MSRIRWLDRKERFALVLALLLVGGCGGNEGTPTALPPDIRRPNQPVPSFDNSSRDFRLTPLPELASATTSDSLSTPVPLVERPSVAAPLAQSPSALAVTRAPVRLLATPNGPLVRDLPSGSTLTITGRSADGTWLAGYTDDGSAGWITTASVALFGGEDLQVVDRAEAPGAIATLLAQAMLPVELPVGLDVASGTTALFGPNAGVVLPSEELTVRNSPQTDGAVIGWVAPGKPARILGRSADSVWLVIEVDGTLGWVSAAEVRTDAAMLPVIRP